MTNRFLPIAGLAVILSACSAGAPVRKDAPLSPEDVVAERAVERWNSIIAKDLPSAYEYMTPGARAVQSYDEYAMRMSTSQVAWLSAKAVKVDCKDPDSCQAEIELTIRTRVPAAGELVIPTYVQEDWVRSKAQWYFLPRLAR